MSDQEAIAKLVQRYGIDGVVSLLRDYTEEQADDYANTPTGPKYDAVGRILSDAAAACRNILK